MKQLHGRYISVNDRVVAGSEGGCRVRRGLKHEVCYIVSKLYRAAEQEGNGRAGSELYNCIIYWCLWHFTVDRRP